MTNESQPRSRFGYLRGNGTAPVRRPEDKTTLERLNDLVKSGQIQPATTEELARRQIARLSQDPHQQAEHEMRSRGHRVKDRKKRRRKDPEPSLYDRQFFGIEE